MAAGDKVRVQYGTGQTEPTAWLKIAEVTDADSVRLPPSPSGTRVWLRARTERPGYRPSVWSPAIYVDIAATSPVIYAASASIAADGTPTLTWTINTLTLGLRLEYSIDVQGAAPAYGTSVDLDAAHPHAGLVGVTVDDGERFNFRVTPYTGFGGGVVSGTAGTVRTGYADMDEVPVGSGFSNGFNTGFGS